MHRAAQELKDAHALMQRIALKVEGTAKKLAPVKTGNLRRTVTSRATAHEAFAGATANYAKAVHDGTKNPDESVRMPARPFVKNAIEQEHNWIENEQERWGEAALRKVGG